MRFVSFSLAAIAMAAPATLTAQEAQTTPPAATQEALPASGDVSDEEVSQFAFAALVIQQVTADEATSEEEQQATIMQAMQQIGLEPQRFNVLAEATQNDAALAERVNVAANAHIQAAQANQQANQ